MTVDFIRHTWQDWPSTETPITADELNRLEEGIAGLYSDLDGIDLENIEDKVDDLEEAVENFKAGVEITQEEYDNLTEEEKNNGTVYYITDAPSTPAISALDASYNNSTSGLQATNVQSAVDEVQGEIDVLNSKSDFTLDTEVVAGTWLGKTLYWKMIRKSFTSSTSALGFPLSDMVSSPTLAWVDVEHSFIDMYFDSSNIKRLIVPFTYHDGQNYLSARVGLTENGIQVFDTFRAITVGTGYIYMALYYTKD